jgi:hypothetical protein
MGGSGLKVRSRPRSTPDIPGNDPEDIRRDLLLRQPDVAPGGVVEKSQFVLLPAALKQGHDKREKCAPEAKLPADGIEKTGKLFCIL